MAYGVDPVTGLPRTQTETGLPDVPSGGTPTIPASAFPWQKLYGDDPSQQTTFDTTSSAPPSSIPPPLPDPTTDPLWSAPTVSRRVMVPTTQPVLPLPTQPGATGQEDWSTPQSQLASLAALIQQGGGWHGTTPEYFQQRINETGGFTPGNIDFWKNMILAGYEAHAVSEQGNGSGSSNPNADAALNDLLARGGSSPFGSSIESILSNIIGQGGMTPDITPSLVKARTDEASAMQGQLADANAQLANMGGVSEPGVTQGPEVSAIERLTSDLGQKYSGNVSDIEQHALDTQNANLTQALSLATGLGQSDARNIIDAIGTGTQRQVALAQIALDQLKTSDSWNEFLANYGLDQAKLQEQINEGNNSYLIALLNAYLTGGQTTGAGHI